MEDSGHAAEPCASRAGVPLPEAQHCLRRHDLRRLAAAGPRRLDPAADRGRLCAAGRRCAPSLRRRGRPHRCRGACARAGRQRQAADHARPGGAAARDQLPIASGRARARRGGCRVRLPCQVRRGQQVLPVPDRGRAGAVAVRPLVRAPRAGGSERRRHETGGRGARGPPRLRVFSDRIGRRLVGTAIEPARRAVRRPWLRDDPHAAPRGPARARGRAGARDRGEWIPASHGQGDRRHADRGRRRPTPGWEPARRSGRARSARGRPHGTRGGARARGGSGTDARGGMGPIAHCPIAS